MENFKKSVVLGAILILITLLASCSSNQTYEDPDTIAARNFRTSVTCYEDIQCKEDEKWHCVVDGWPAEQTCPKNLPLEQTSYSRGPGCGSSLIESKHAMILGVAESDNQLWMYAAIGFSGGSSFCGYYRINLARMPISEEFSLLDDEWHSLDDHKLTTCPDPMPDLNCPITHPIYHCYSNPSSHKITRVSDKLTIYCSEAPESGLRERGLYVTTIKIPAHGPIEIEPFQND